MTENNLNDTEQAILAEMRAIRPNLRVFNFDERPGFDYDDYQTGIFVRDGFVAGVQFEEGDFQDK